MVCFGWKGLSDFVTLASVYIESSYSFEKTGFFAAFHWEKVQLISEQFSGRLLVWCGRPWKIMKHRKSVCSAVTLASFLLQVPCSAEPQCSGRLESSCSLQWLMGNLAMVAVPPRHAWCPRQAYWLWCYFGYGHQTRDGNCAAAVPTTLQPWFAAQSDAGSLPGDVVGAAWHRGIKVKRGDLLIPSFVSFHILTKTP